MVCRQIASRPGYRRGMVAIMAAVCFTVLLAAAALALDGGALLTERRHAQETADAAALAAADDLFLNYPANNGVDSGGTAASWSFSAIRPRAWKSCSCASSTRARRIRAGATCRRRSRAGRMVPPRPSAPGPIQVRMSGNNRA